MKVTGCCRESSGEVTIGIERVENEDGVPLLHPTRGSGECHELSQLSLGTIEFDTF